MKKILCYGDSNVWGNIPGSFNAETGLSQSYPKNKQWTGIMQKYLGDTYDVITVGINARTTNRDEIVPGRPYKNGLKDLPIFLETYYPIDLIIFWLGTNDTKVQYERSPKEITEGMRALIHAVKKSSAGPFGKPPKVLIISPQPILKGTGFYEQLNDASIEKSEALASHYKILAEEENCGFLDAGAFVTSSKIDGVHLDEIACAEIGKIAAEKVEEMFTKTF